MGAESKELKRVATMKTLRRPGSSMSSWMNLSKSGSPLPTGKGVVAQHIT